MALSVMSGVAPAHAESPWWGLTLSSRPTSIQPGTAKEEIQEVTLTATGGSFILAEPLAVERGEFFNSKGEPEFAELPDNATAAEVEAGLAGFYGPGNVKVTGGPQSGASKFVVTFTGALAYKPLRLISTRWSEEFGYTAPGQLTVTELSHGAVDGHIVVTAENLGDANANGERAPVTIADVLPAGLKAVAVEASAGEPLGHAHNRGPVTCSLGSLTCTFEGTLDPYENIEMVIAVVVESGATVAGEDEAEVSGGRSETSRHLRRALAVGGEAQFGIQEWRITPEAEGGATESQAGSHPFQTSFTLTLDQTAEGQPVSMPKDLRFDLPPGLVGNPTQFTHCTDAQFALTAGLVENDNQCPADSAIGVASITYNEPDTRGLNRSDVPVFNLVPRAGEPARLGFVIIGNPVFIDTSVRTGGDYGVSLDVHNITQIAGFLGSTVTIWGAPGDRRHEGQRGWACLAELSSCTHLSETAPAPFMTFPTSCTGPLQSSASGDPWTQAGAFVQPVSAEEPVAMDGCNKVNFAAEIGVAPDVADASTPTGLEVKVHVPQGGVLEAEGVAESTLKDTTVTLPPGVTLNPAGADGLLACSEADIGFLGKEAADPALNLFTATLPEPFCPDGSKIGTVEIETPLLPNPLKGAVYLATPAPFGEHGMNPFDSLLAMYIVAEDPVSGTLVKLPGKVIPCQEVGSTVAGVRCEAMGQLISTFEDTPQLPFENLTLHFFGGSRAPLSTPPLCGTYTTHASFVPWSGNPPVEANSRFDITSGPNGSPCANPRPFAPGLEAGSTNIQAGAFTPFTTTMSRPDADQPIGALSMKMPPGLLGLLSSVKLCEEPQASRGECGPESVIGHTVVSAGLGSNPVTVKKPGAVYITGPYEGAPFGLSIVNPTEAGPFNLGPVVVRAKIEVDPLTAQLTVNTDSSGPFKIPTVLQGIPLQLQHVNVTVDRPGFTFNPTNCSPLGINGTMMSAEGASAPVSTPFQVTNCARLGFKPQFHVHTSAKTTRRAGAKLDVKLAYPRAPFGSLANIAQVKVSLPRQLPSRLSTLQKACPDTVFERNPSACPVGSRVGHAKAVTPVLPVPLEGPAYFVSHGSARFPELIIVLQGYGVTVDVHGETLIKKGITTSTFRRVPDVPIRSFELVLPQGPNSALAASGNLCKGKLVMPTTFVGQNGAQIKRKTTIAVSGCHRRAGRLNHHRKKRHGTRTPGHRK